MALLIAAGAALPARAGEAPEERSERCYTFGDIGCPDSFGPLLLQDDALGREPYAAGFGSGFTYSRGSAGGKRTGKFHAVFQGGARYFTHYNRQRVLSTPPETMIVEGQLQLWYRSAFAIYFTGGIGVAFSSAQIYGIGAKLPFLSFNDQSGEGATFSLVADAVQIQYPDPTPPDDYATSLNAIRYGLALDVSFGSSPVFLDVTAMMTYLNNNFFIAPLIGLGYRF